MLPKINTIEIAKAAYKATYFIERECIELENLLVSFCRQHD